MLKVARSLITEERPMMIAGGESVAFDLGDGCECVDEWS
jgi:hypothetical protein